MSEVRYPIYIPTKGRAHESQTAKVLMAENIPFHLVIEEAEYDDYEQVVGADRLLVLPFSDQGSVIPARNWIKHHSIERGASRHWQLDDNLGKFYRFYKSHRIPCDARVAMRCLEDFTDRYENIGVSGLEYFMFAPKPLPSPIVLNTRVYSCSLVNNETPFEWRGRYNEDTDLCLQMLSTGYWTTLLMNAFLVLKQPTMVSKGGNTAELYSKQDGRLKMSRTLERRWPGTVETKRKFHRPQHYVKANWGRFDNPLVRRTDIDWGALAEKGPDEYGIKLEQVGDTKSPRLQKMYEEFASTE